MFSAEYTLNKQFSRRKARIKNLRDVPLFVLSENKRIVKYVPADTIRKFCLSSSCGSVSIRQSDKGGYMISRKITFVFLISGVLCMIFSGVAYAMDTDHVKIKLGAFEIIALHDASIVMDAKLLKNADAGIIRKYMPDGNLPASINTFVVKTGRHTVLIDSGLGTGSPRKGKTIEALKNAGISPSSIDIALITHAHADHIGGLIIDGTAAYPNAKLYISKDELSTFDDAAFHAMNDDAKKYYQTAHNLLTVYKNRIETIIPGKTIVDGISSVDLAGHTKGQVGYLIRSGNETFLMFGDLLHISAIQFPHPEICLVYDADIAKASEVRRATLAKASSENILVAGSHIQFPGIGRVSTSTTGFVFTPVK